MTAATARLHVGQGTKRGALTVFPVWTDADEPPLDHVTGADAYVEVSERTGSPVVGELVVTNGGPLPALLLAGELLEGGLQHRAIASSVLLAPGRRAVVPVVCVEQGRWHGGGSHGRRARHAPATVRARLEGVHAQERVWSSVRRYETVGGPSDTDSLVERMDGARHAARALTRGLRLLPGQRGLLVGVGGRAVRLDVFDSTAALAAHWSGLLESAAIESLSAPPACTPAARARALAERVERTDLVPAGPAGLARRFSSRGRPSIDAVRWRHRTLHLSAVATTEES